MRLRDRLSEIPFVTDVYLLDRCSSTNDEIRSRAATGAREGTVVVATAQTAGRGRMGRRWHSPHGLGLYISVLIRPREPIAHATRWTLSAAVAACEACRESAGCEVTIKWPNDLVVGRLKVAGVLAELRGSGDASELTIGTGINVHHGTGDFPDDLKGIATSLKVTAGGVALDSVELAAAYVSKLGWIHDRFSHDGWDDVSRRWIELAPTAQGTRVRVARTDATDVIGTTRGIDEFGALLVDCFEGDEALEGERIVVRSVDRVRWLEE